MLYLTKLEFAARHVENYRLLGSDDRDYIIHQIVELLQPDDKARRRLLWRLEEPTDALPYVLVQSDFLPSAERLSSKYSDRVRIATKGFEPLTREGQLFSFRLRANTARRHSKPQERGHASPIRSEDEALSWIDEKAELSGFKLISVNWNREKATFFANKEQKITFASSKYDGVISVVDASKFADTIRRGIGRGKAFGFGLLSVAPLNAH